MKIKSKAEFFELWKQGVLGNRPNLFEDAMDAYLSNAKNIGFRELGKTGGGWWVLVPREDIFQTAAHWEFNKKRYIMDDGCPNELTVLVGEVGRTYRGLEGVLAVNSGCSMRESQRKGLLLPRTGATIHALLNEFMDPSSREDLWDLLDLYPDATVEFSCFSVNVGVFPNRNTLFWETRNY